MEEAMAEVVRKKWSTTPFRINWHVNIITVLSYRERVIDDLDEHVYTRQARISTIKKGVYDAFGGICRMCGANVKERRLDTCVMAKLGCVKTKRLWWRKLSILGRAY